MKTFLWFMTAALAVLCMACWCGAELLFGFLEDYRPEFALPALTQIVLAPHGWLLLCPIPWAVTAIILCRRPQVSQPAAFIFAGTIALAMTVVLALVVISGALPLIPMKN